MSRQTRATTVVSQPRMFSTSLVLERLRRNHDSCTASSASLSEPSIRYATASRWARCSSNSLAWRAPSLTVTSSPRDPSLGRRSTTDRCDKEAEMIEVEKLRKVYPGGVEAVAGIDFEVAPGEVFALLGPNGAGKSTTIGMLTTTVRPTERHRAARRLRRADAAAGRAQGEQRRLPGRRGRSLPDRPPQPRPARSPLGRRAGGGGAANRRARGRGRAARPRRPAGRHLQRRRAAQDGDRTGPGLEPARPLPRRADGRARSAHPRGAARCPRRVCVVAAS